MSRWGKVSVVGLILAVVAAYGRREPHTQGHGGNADRDPCLGNSPNSRTISVERELLHYCEGRRWLTFDIYLVRRFLRREYWKMYVPTRDCWTRRTPDWAARRRGEILGTIADLGLAEKMDIHFEERTRCSDERW
jgi:hypothetical protein